MNVAEINPGTLGTVGRYVAVAIPFTIFTAWIIIAFQSKYIFPGEVPFWWRLTWPAHLLYERFFKKPSPSDSTANEDTNDDEYKIAVEDMNLPTVTHSGR